MLIFFLLHYPPLPPNLTTDHSAFEKATKATDGPAVKNGKQTSCRSRELSHVYMKTFVIQFDSVYS